MHLIDREKLAWAAGFYEGEGHIRPRFNEGFNGIEMKVYNTNREPLEKFREALGLGVVRLDKTRDNPKHKPLYVWQVSRFELAQAAIVMLWGWLSERRREQAKTALIDCRSRWSTGHRGRRARLASA